MKIAKLYTKQRLLTKCSRFFLRREWLMMYGCGCGSSLSISITSPTPPHTHHTPNSDLPKLLTPENLIGRNPSISIIDALLTFDLAQTDIQRAFDCFRMALLSVKGISINLTAFQVLERNLSNNIGEICHVFLRMLRTRWQHMWVSMSVWGVKHTK
jgi:hypothetical protein